ncbi:DUF2480 family protein [Wenyingzhuangia sp. 2_MG-2023]|uniref:DUF2480 family protein n=1 Tax=Wenyingzhuangia sp. 2_MG-2023 TaxID=3062639 RepID=UPI0026E3CAA4|nr:DUF2480 family protein [Wenyingzhuangia sp. 2_MG-2023]MDO6737655.1 DUF2480 family protein [Wenyingzhuangia sp. 2_MG-2023]MDO6802494.1 DUF2480 family protein [Wenyingzhuangia sp. 1_MG-2023]
MDEIVNRVANSSLKNIDLEDYYPTGKRVLFDIKDWLFEEIILKEKDFREKADSYNWSQLQDSYVAFTCSADAIIPSWAYLLLTTKASKFAKKCVVGDLKILETVLYTEIIFNLKIEDFQDKPIIIKGCANKPIPESAYTLLIQKLLPIAKNIMYGEACSTVPLFKK